MDTNELIGLFLIGTLKTSGATFMGVCDEVDDKFIYMTFKGAKKWVLISEIAELKAEEYNPSKEVSE